MTTLALNGADAQRMLGALADTDETGWVLAARRVEHADLLLGRSLTDVPHAAYLEREPRRLTIASTGFVPAFSAARHDDALPIFVHTHPGGRPEPSELDHSVDRLLRDHARERDLPGYASLVVAGTPRAPSVCGRLWLGEQPMRPITRLRVAGNEFRVLLADDDSHEPAPLFDRQVRAFSAAGQRLLGALRIGVVGAGGTGSPTIEQLARLGVGQIVVVDDDVVDDTNLTRIHESTTDDVGTPKAELACRRARSYGTGTTPTAVHATVASINGFKALTGCDVVFGCTDDNAGRLVLNRLAYRYLIPVIDCGAVVSPDEKSGTVRDVCGRVTLIAPGEPCLLCRGQVDAQLAGEEMLDPETRRARAGEGYAQGAQGPAPAVVAFTTGVSALAVNEMLGRLLGYADSTSSNLLVRFSAQTISRGGRGAVEGHMCVNPAEWALGDTDPPLGISGLK